MSIESRIDHWVSPAVRALSAYHVPPSAGLIKLDAMENPYGWPPSLIEAWLSELRGAEINRYPDPDAGELKRGLRDFLGVGRDAPLLLGNGSDELIQMMAMAMASPGRTILAPEPTFVMYRLIAEVLGFRFVGVPLRPEDFALDVGAMLDAIATHQPAIVFLAWPNNPTGNLFADADLRRIIAAAPGLVVIDEAYYPFARRTWLGELSNHENVVVMQTLSKAGLAGLRVGMLLGPAAWLDQFNKVRMPYNINVLSQRSAAFVLRHAEVLQQQTTRIVEDRATLLAELSRLPDLHVWPSEANFLLCRVSGDARAVFDAVRAQGVLVKCLHGAHPLLANCLRLTVGSPEQNARLLEALSVSL